MAHFSQVFSASILKRSFLFIIPLALCSALFFLSPISASAQSADASLSASPASVSIGQPITVSYSVATTSFRTSDDIVMIDAGTRRLITSQNVGSARTGQKTFSTRTPGTYYFQYRANTRYPYPVFATSSLVTVALPDPSLYTLTPSATTLQSGEPLTVTYAAPAFAHQSSDDIVIIDTATNRQVTTQTVGTSPSGAKTFTLRTPGTYLIQYKLSVTGSPVAKTAGPVTVRIPDASLYSLSVSATTLNSGEPLVVSYSAPAYAHQSSDDIVIYDTVSGRQVMTQSVGTSPSGTKTFTLRVPGTYRVDYKLAFTGTPVVRSAGPVTIRIPDASLYTLSTSATTLNSGEPLLVIYGAPAYAHQSGDDIVIIDTATNRQVTSQSLGSAPSGTKTFTLRTPGTYRVDYKLSFTGTPVIRSTGPVMVRIPDASLFTLSSDISIAEVDQPITVTFSAPQYAHQSSDDLLVYDTATNRIVSTTNVGASPTGAKTFKIGTPGSYAFAYRMNISGQPVITRTGNTSVVYVNLPRIANHPLRQGPIIALGDSITYGRDAIIDTDFVSLLSNRLGEEVINAGVSGDTTMEALARLEADVLSENPRLVIVFLGGNDFLQKVPSETTFANLETIVERITADGAAVLILGYQDYFLTNYDIEYRSIAWDEGAAYTPNVMGGILGNPFYTTDLIHPRTSGHKIIADRVEPYLRALLGQ